MQIKKTLSDWLNRHFFVKERTPRVIIGVGSALIGVAVGIYVDFSLRVDEGFFGRQAAKLIGLIACLATGFIVLFPVSGIYNICKRLIEKGSSKT